MKTMFPTADIAVMVSKRPSIVLSPEWDGLKQGRDALKAILPDDAEIDKIVEQQPLLLVTDLQAAVNELRRFIPGSDPGKLIAEKPQILLQVMDNSVLSLW